MESLQFTIGSDTAFIQKLKVLNHKRNQSSYDAAGVTSDEDLAFMIHVAEEMRTKIAAWLEKVHPELLKD